MAGLLRFCTAGHVDDGKSTLIGRLLYDARAVHDDQVRSLESASRRRGVDLDLSLLTDGLRAEREQGITIDVAYRYFATPRRTFILADTPGHEQYTRNMATGASTADLAVLLVDAAHGLRDQTRRHARIAALMGVASFVLAVNKMDLVGFDPGVFLRVVDEFLRVEPDLAGAVTAVPVSALDGDNVARRSGRTAWYEGPTLLECLEEAPVRDAVGAGAGFRMPVQIVLRPGAGERLYAGQVTSGAVRVGDEITVSPSAGRAVVRRITAWGGDRETAEAPASVALGLDRDLDVGRGDVLADEGIQAGTGLDATVVWMDERPLSPGRPYLLKLGSRLVLAETDAALALNEIGRVAIRLREPVAADAYRRHRATGAFVLIDPASRFTSGAGMVDAIHVGPRPDGTTFTAAARLAREARAALTDEDAVHAVWRVLDEVLR